MIPHGPSSGAATADPLFGTVNDEAALDGENLRPGLFA